MDRRRRAPGTPGFTSPAGPFNGKAERDPGMPTKAKDIPLWSRFVPPAVIAIGVATVAGCGLGAWQWGAPTTAPTVYPFAETWYSKSLAATTPAEGIADARKATLLQPYAPENWMLLAYQYSVADQGVSPRVIAAVRQSYAVSALKVDASEYRLGFIFRYWKQMPADVREMAKTETRTFASIGRGITFLHESIPTIADPHDRLELGVMAMAAYGQAQVDFLKKSHDTGARLYEDSSQEPY